MKEVHPKLPRVVVMELQEMLVLQVELMGIHFQLQETLGTLQEMCGMIQAFPVLMARVVELEYHLLLIDLHPVVNVLQMNAEMSLKIAMKQFPLHLQERIVFDRWSKLSIRAVHFIIEGAGHSCFHITNYN